MFICIPMTLISMSGMNQFLLIGFIWRHVVVCIILCFGQVMVRMINFGMWIRRYCFVIIVNWADDFHICRYFFWNGGLFFGMVAFWFSLGFITMDGVTWWRLIAVMLEVCIRQKKRLCFHMFVSLLMYSLIMGVINTLLYHA